MQKLISKYGLAAHLALLAVAPLFLFPFFGADDTAVVLLWLSLGGGLWLFLEPSRRSGEMLHNARSRVVRSLVRDPLFWLLVLLVAVAGARWANAGLGMAVDLDTNKFCISRPPLNWLPGSVAGVGRLWFSTAVAALVVVEGCRHALGKAARLSFVFIAALLAGVAAIAAVSVAKIDTTFAAKAIACGFGEPSYAGTAFGLYFVGSFVAFAGAFEQKWNKYLLLFSFAIGTTASGLLYFAPVHVALWFGVLGAVALIGSLVYVGTTQRFSCVLKYMAGVIVAVLIPVLLGICVAPPAVTEAKLAAFQAWPLLPEEFAVAREAFADVALKCWRADMWLGAGAGYFPLELRFAATDAEWWYEPWWALWRRATPATALNGWLQILAERGIIGTAALLLPVGFIAVSFALRLIGALGRRVFIPLPALGLVATLAVAVEGFVDGAPTRPDVILALGAFLALSASAFPGAHKDEDISSEQTGD